MAFLIIAGILTNFQNRVSHGFFVSPFEETLYTDGSRMVFKGKMIISKIGFRVEVISPEKQVITGKGKEMRIFTEGSDEPVIMENPLGLNVLLFNPETLFTVQEKGNRVFLQPADTVYIKKITIDFSKGLPVRVITEMEGQRSIFIFTSPSVFKEFKGLFSPPSWNRN